MKPISWPFDVCRDLESGLSSVFVKSEGADATDAGITRFIASTDAEDRALDVVSQSNWNLESFKANSPILDNHDPYRVVGVGTRAEVVNGQLEIDVRWDDESPDPSIRAVGHQHRKAIRKAGSVGFRAGSVTPRDQLPKDHKFYREPVTIKTPFGDFKHAGLFFDAPELLEFSSATIPMNPQALQRSLVQRLQPQSLDIDAVIRAIKGATPEQVREIKAALGLLPPDEEFAAEFLRHLKGHKR